MKRYSFYALLFAGALALTAPSCSKETEASKDTEVTKNNGSEQGGGTDTPEKKEESTPATKADLLGKWKVVSRIPSHGNPIVGANTMHQSVTGTLVSMEFKENEVTFVTEGTLGDTRTCPYEIVDGVVLVERKMTRFWEAWGRITKSGDKITFTLDLAAYQIQCDKNGVSNDVTRKVGSAVCVVQREK